MMAILMTTLTAEHSASTLSKRRRYFALGVVALAFVMDILDTTIVNVAIPSIQSGFHTSYTAIEWIIAGYALAFSLLLITGGKLGDSYGYHTLFLAGVAGFTIASLLCGLAWTPEVLVAARVLQGATAALMLPQVMALMQIMFAPHERVQVQGVFGLMGGASASLGPVIGALLIQANIHGMSWRPIFLINVPVGILALVMGWYVLPRGRSSHPLGVDFLGTALLLCALLLLVFPLIQGREAHWAPWCFAMLVASPAIFFWLAKHVMRRQRNGLAPLVMPSLFHERSFSLGLVVSFFFNIAMSGYLLIFTLLIQIGYGYSVLRAGLCGIPFAVGVAFSMAFLSKRILPKLGRTLIVVGAGFLCIAMLSMTALLLQYQGSPPPMAMLLLPQLIAGFGLGMFLGTMSPVILCDVDIRYAGAASGILSSVQQLCNAMGAWWRVIPASGVCLASTPPFAALWYWKLYCC
jgi:EmrB/QacA subfamily drug resistance transporter